MEAKEKKIKEIIQSKMTDCYMNLKRREIEFSSNSHVSGKELCGALVTYLTSSGVPVKKVKSGATYKHFELVFGSDQAVRDAFALVQKAKTEKNFVTARRVSHNANDELTVWQKIGRGLGNAANWVTNTIDVLNDGQEAEANAMAAQAAAQVEIAKANAEAEKSKTGVYIGVGLGALALVVLLVVLVSKK